jgi:hypothetical protein
VESIRGVAARPWGPLVLAVGLALGSIPFAAVSIHAVSADRHSYPGPPTFVDWGVAVPMAVVAVLLAALVAGTVAGFVVRRRPVGGMVLALFLAWPVAIVSLPIIPALFEVPYSGLWFCIDSCSAMISSSPLSGATAYLLGVWIGVVGPIEIAAILAGLGYWASRRHHRSISAVFGMAAWLTFNAWVIAFPTLDSFPGVLPAALALLVGCAFFSGVYVPAHDVVANPAEPAPAVS